MPKYVDTQTMIVQQLEKLNITLDETLIFFLSSFHAFTTYELLQEYEDAERADDLDGFFSRKGFGIGVIATLAFIDVLDRQPNMSKATFFAELLVTAKSLVEASDLDLSVDREKSQRLLVIAEKYTKKIEEAHVRH